MEQSNGSMSPLEANLGVMSLTIYPCHQGNSVLSLRFFLVLTFHEHHPWVILTTGPVYDGFMQSLFSGFLELHMSQKWENNSSCWEMMVYETSYINYETFVIVQYLFLLS